MNIISRRKRPPRAGGRPQMQPQTTSPPTPGVIPVMPDWADGDGPYGAGTTRYDLGAGAWPSLTGRPQFVANDEELGAGVPVNAWQTASEFDWDVGGQPGMVGHLGYTAGVVDTNTVEDFELTGRVIKVRRPVEGIMGPVATPDYAASFLPAYAQQGYRETPDAILYPDLGAAI